MVQNFQGRERRKRYLHALHPGKLEKTANRVTELST